MQHNPYKLRRLQLPAELENEQAIIKQCRKGDIHAFKIIYEYYGKSLYRVALRMLSVREDAEDAVQLTFMNLYKSIGQFRADAKLSTYLFSILLNVCYDKINDRKRNQMTLITDTDLSEKPQNDLKMQLDAAIVGLPERMQECFILFAVEGFKQSEIAEILNVSVGTVKAHIFAAKEKLRSELYNV